MKSRMTATERDAMLRLNVAFEILETEPEKLTRRMAGIPYAARDIGLMKAHIRRLVVALTDTIPDEQLPHWVRMLKASTYYVGTRNPADRNRDEKEFGYWLSIDTINTMLAGLHDKCLLCELDRGQRRACPLKKALDTIPNDTADREDGDCQYYGVI